VLRIAREEDRRRISDLNRIIVGTACVPILNQCVREGRNAPFWFLILSNAPFCYYTKTHRFVYLSLSLFLFDYFLSFFFELILIIPKRTVYIKRFGFILIPFFSFHRFLSFFLYFFLIKTFQTHKHHTHAYIQQGS
jgi:hypothetical protein